MAFSFAFVSTHCLVGVMLVVVFKKAARIPDVEL